MIVKDRDALTRFRIERDIAGPVAEMCVQWICQEIFDDIPDDASLDGFVYFIGDKDEWGSAWSDLRMKIGYSNDPRARLSQLQIGNPNELRLIAAIPGNEEVEAAFHRVFGRQRIRGEWFSAWGIHLATIRHVATRLSLTSRSFFDHDLFHSLLQPNVNGWHDSWTRRVGAYLEDADQQYAIAEAAE